MSSFDTPEMLEAMSAVENKDYVLSLKLLETLAAAGNPKAQCNLATLYQVGLGVEVNENKAVELYLRVAERQILEEHLSAIAYNNLATIYCSTDPKKAGEYQRRAEALGFDIASTHR
jgi:TPR repeat protein